MINTTVGVDFGVRGLEVHPVRSGASVPSGEDRSEVRVILLKAVEHGTSRDVLEGRLDVKGNQHSSRITADGRRSKPHTRRAASLHVSWLVEASEMGKTAAPEIERVLVEQGGEVVVVSQGVELVSDVRNVVTSFLAEDLCEPLASWAWVSLDHGEAILVVHEIANRIGERDVKVGLGNTKA